MSIKVTLEWYEWQCAALIGMMGYCDALRTGRKHRYGGLQGPKGMPESLVHLHFAGAELAVAKALDHYWPPLIGAPPEGFPDVFPNLEIRWTPDGNLVLHDEDHDDRPYILVRGLGPNYEIIGWMYARDGKQRQWWRADWDRPAYCVPESALHTDFAQRRRTLALETFEEEKL